MCLVTLDDEEAYMKKKTHTEIQWGLHFFLLDSRRVLPPAVLGGKRISNPDVAPF